MEVLNFVIAAQKGDKQAFSQLYLAYKESLYRYAWFKLGNDDDAMDAVADTMLCAFEQIKNLKNSKAFSTYLFSIHRASCAKYQKQIIKEKNNSDLADFENQISSSADFKSIELRDALNKLEDEEKEMVLLSASGFNSKEIASITGYTSGAVRSKLSRTYAKMRTYLE